MRCVDIGAKLSLAAEGESLRLQVQNAGLNNGRVRLSPSEAADLVNRILEWEYAIRLPALGLDYLTGWEVVGD